MGRSFSCLSFRISTAFASIVRIEPLAGLAPVHPGGDHLPQQGRGGVAVGAEGVVEHFRDVERGVQADEIEQFERTEGVAAPQDHARVDVLFRGHARFEQAHRVQQVGDEEVVDDEARRVLDLDHLLAQRFAELPGRFHSLLTGLQSDNHFDESHHGHGIEEMKAQDLFGPVCRRGQFGDRNGGGVARQDGAGRRDAVEGAEDLLLGFQVFGHRLDDQVAFGEVTEFRGARDAPEHGRLFLVRHPSPGYVPRQDAVDSPDAAAHQLVGCLADDRPVTRLGAHLRDARSHQSTSDDAHGFNGHAGPSRCCTSGYSVLCVSVLRVVVCVPQARGHLLQRSHSFLEPLAAFLEIGEHVVTGTGGRQHDHITEPRKAGAFPHGVIERFGAGDDGRFCDVRFRDGRISVGRTCPTGFPDCGLNRVRGRADQDDRPGAPNDFLRHVVEGRPLVVPARDQDDRPVESPKRRDRRRWRGAGRIVVVTHTIDNSHLFQAVLHAAERLDR